MDTTNGFYFILNKNKNYKVYKLCKGINLRFFRRKKRENGYVGISTEKYGTKWFITKKGKAIFKTYENLGEKSHDFRIINELLYCKLAKQIGVECAVYEPATIGKNIGLVSYNVASEDEELINGQKFNLFKFNFNKYSGYEESIDYYKKQKAVINAQKMKRDIFKLMVLDALVFQEDRHINNVHFLHNKKTNEYKLAPIIDNEFAFAGKTFSHFLNKQDMYLAGISLGAFMTIIDHNYRSIITDVKMFSDGSFDRNIRNIIAMAKKDPVKKSFLIKAINKIDIKKAIKEVEDIGYDISPDYKQYLIDLIDLSRTMFTDKMNTRYIKKQDEYSMWNLRRMYEIWNSWVW